MGQARLHGFVRRLMRDHVPTVTILLVGHGGLYRVALPGLLENVRFDFAHRYPIRHCTVIRARAEGGSLVCESWGAR